MTDVPTNDHPLDPIFHPRATAIVGVSSRPNHRGGFLSALMEAGYHEHHGLYPVNPKLDEIEGLQCYPGVLDCPDPVDHVISQIPADGTALLIDQCIKKGVRSVHFYTAGYSETGNEARADLEAEIVRKARAAGVRLIGPNCMGLYVPGVGLTFMGGFPQEPGNVFLASQSGANAGDIIGTLARRGVRFSKAVSYGNAADIQPQDLFDYAAEDPQTEVVIAYMEGRPQRAGLLPGAEEVRRREAHDPAQGRALRGRRARRQLAHRLAGRVARHLRGGLPPDRRDPRRDAR